MAKESSKGSTSSKTTAKGVRPDKNDRKKSEQKRGKKMDGQLRRKSSRKRAEKTHKSATESDETDGEEVEFKHRDVFNRNSQRNSRNSVRKLGFSQKYRSVSSQSSKDDSHRTHRHKSSSSESEKCHSKRRDDQKPQNRRKDGTCPDSSPSSSSSKEISNSDSDHSRERRSFRRTPVKEVKVDNNCGHSSLEAYLAQFRLAAAKNRWPSKEWGTELALRLREETRNLILPEADNDPLTFKKTVKQLREMFKEPKNPSFYVAQMRTRRRKEKEPAQWFKKIGLKAYPSKRASTRERILLDTFVRALPDEQQWCYNWDTELKGLENFVSAALRYEAIWHTEDQANSN